MGKFKNSDIIIIIVLPTPLLDNQKDRFSEKWATIDLGCLSVFRCAVFVWGPAASDLGSGRSGDSLSSALRIQKKLEPQGVWSPS